MCVCVCVCVYVCISRVKVDPNPQTVKYKALKQHMLREIQEYPTELYSPIDPAISSWIDRSIDLCIGLYNQSSSDPQAETPGAPLRYLLSHSAPLLYLLRFEISCPSLRYLLSHSAPHLYRLRLRL